MSRKRPRSEEVESALQLNEENGDSLLNGHSLNDEELEESHFLNGASSSGVEYSSPVVSTQFNI